MKATTNDRANFIIFKLSLHFISHDTQVRFKIEGLFSPIFGIDEA
jgi:hypothetical protein